MKKIISLALVLMMLVCLMASCGNVVHNTDDGSGTSGPESTGKAPSADVTGKKKVTSEITVKDYGVITLELDAKAAPITVANFVKLAKSGFYDGLTFHRIASGFMVQGGDPLGNGTGGSDEMIKGEFSNNGVKNFISHKRGVISMARNGSRYEGINMATVPAEYVNMVTNDINNAYNSANSQFFIVHEDSEFLDGKYAAFGHVTSGMEIIDAICRNAKPVNYDGYILPDDQPIIESIRIIEK